MVKQRFLAFVSPDATFDKLVDSKAFQRLRVELDSEWIAFTNNVDDTLQRELENLTSDARTQVAAYLHTPGAAKGPADKPVRHLALVASLVQPLADGMVPVLRSSAVDELRPVSHPIWAWLIRKAKQGRVVVDREAARVLC